MTYRRVLELLTGAGIEFVVIGGVAATIHGSASVTYDLDICYSRKPENLKRLASALAPFNPRPRDFPGDLPFVWDEATIRNSTVLTLQTSIGKLDLLAEVAGLGGYEDVKRHSKVVDTLGRQIPILDLAALIQAKRAGGWPKDLAAIPELESLLEALEPEQ